MAEQRSRGASRTRASRTRTRAASGGSGVRWLALPLGLALAGAALYVLATDGAPPISVSSGPPLDHIDAASRERLERVLRDADAP